MGRGEAEVAHDLVVKELVFPFGSGADVVDNPFLITAGAGTGNHDADMAAGLLRRTIGEFPSHHVANCVVVERVGFFENLPEP